MKIAIIGAGSHVFARNLITDFLSYPALRESTISLMDIDEEALKLTTSFTRKLVDRSMERIPGGPSMSLAETRRRLDKIMEHQREHGFSLRALIRKVDGKLIGDCGLILVEGRGPEVELSYDIAYEFWGRGFATEAARECLRYGLEDLGLERIIGLTYEDHRASRRVMEKIGMTYDRIVHHYNCDLVQYSATKREEGADL